MNSIGNTLKEARNKKSISLEEVHARTKIHPRVIQLLEEDKFEKLPSSLYVKSFLKSYAEFLEINPEEIIESYEKHGLHDPEQRLYISPASERGKKQIFNQNTIGAVVLSAAILAGGFLAVKLVASASQWISKKTVTAPKKSKAKKAVKAAPVKPAKVEEPAQAPSPEWLRSVSQGNFPKLNRKTPLLLNVSAIDNVWLRVTCDGKVLFQSILKKGASETWTAQKNIEIWTGNSSNMALNLNEHSLGSPGKGVIKRMLIDHEGVRIPS